MSKTKEPIPLSDLYYLLELDRNATNDDIQKAYRRLSLKSHPDHGGTELQFKELTRAKDILMDAQKRQIYDLYGIKGVQLYEENGGVYSTRDIPKCDPIELTIELTLGDIYSEKEFVMTVDVNDDDEYGNRYTSKKKITYKVPSDQEFNKTVMLENIGHSKHDHKNGDVYITLVEKKDSGIDKFEIRCSDLYCERTINLTEIITGYTIVIHHPNGETLYFESNPFSGNDIITACTPILKNLDGYGMPLPLDIRGRNGKTHGKLTVKIIPNIPIFTPEERKLLKNAMSSSHAKFKVADLSTTLINAKKVQAVDEKIQSHRQPTNPIASLLTSLGLNNLPGIDSAMNSAGSVNINGIPNNLSNLSNLNLGGMRRPAQQQCAQQ